MSDDVLKLHDFELPPDTLVITPNASLAKSILAHCIRRNSAKPMPAGRVVSLTEWLHQVVVETPAQTPATEIQMRVLWETVIEDMELGIDLHPPTLAPLALKAWRYLKQWRVPPEELIRAEFGQEVQFSRWCKLFEQRLAKAGMLTLEHLAEQQIAQTQRRTNQKILLVNFIEPPTPLWESLLESRASSVEQFRLSVTTGTIEQYAATDTEAEIVAVSQWVKQRLESQPNARIGVVSTDDTKRLDKVERSLWLQGIDSNCGRPLSSEGVIGAALGMLKSNLAQIDLADARAIVQSPFFGNYPTDLYNRAKWEGRICALQTRSLSRSDFFYCLRESETFNAVREHIRQLAPAASPIEWANIFQHQLNLFGWPGKRPMKPSQVKATEGWFELLGELATMGHLYPSISGAKALQLLNQLARSGIFHSRTSAKVHLLDRIEAANGYDFLWILSCDDEHWPGNPSPQPLIPVRIQNKYGMPRCSPVQELALSKKLLASLTQRANQVVCSYASSDGDQNHRLTPLLDNPPILQLDQSPIDRRQADFEFIDCSHAPPLADNQRQVTGGSRLMQLMAASPFDAFAQYRLNAYPLDKPFEGVSPMQMGQLIHDLLDRFWTSVQSKSALLEKGPTVLDQIIEYQVQATLKDWKTKRKLGHRQIQLVTHRLTELLHDWIPLELQRDEFTIVDTERALSLEIGGIELQLRIDRIDKTADGLLLIDYKSGGAGSVNDWLGSPPQEPQLPLYALAMDGDVAAIAFAKIRKGESRWVALGCRQLMQPMQVMDNWSELKQGWHTHLNQLAESFARGYAVVRETDSGYFQDDPLRALHRFDEYEELTKCLPNK